MILIKNGRVIDPSIQRDEVLDILVEDGKILQVENNIPIQGNYKVIDAEGKWVTPGLIDMHVHLREPGFEHKETIATGTKAAAVGGFTTVACMPNTRPSIDNHVMIEYIYLKAEKEGCVNVLPVGAITIGQQGKRTTDVEEMVSKGCKAISEDGKSVMDEKLMKEGMEKAAALGIPVLNHCEDLPLATGCMHGGERAKELGLRGIPREAEDNIVARDMELARITGCHLHIQHISTKGAVDLVRKGKKEGIKITAEVCPHHFLTTDQVVDGVITNTKMNPPLREEEDVEAILEGLVDGTIDAIATDHAPHTEEEKAQEYEKAPFGIVGLETAVGLTIKALVKTNLLTPLECVRKLTTNPAEILKIDKGTLQVGKDADITIIDPEVEYNIDINKFVSKSKNSPYHGEKAVGKAVLTMVKGKIIMLDGEILGEETTC